MLKLSCTPMCSSDIPQNCPEVSAHHCVLLTTQGATGLLSIVNADNTSVRALLPHPSALGKAFFGRQYRWTHVDKHVSVFPHRTRSPECKTFASWRLLLPSRTQVSSWWFELWLSQNTSRQIDFEGLNYQNMSKQLCKNIRNIVNSVFHLTLPVTMKL